MSDEFPKSEEVVNPSLEDNELVKAINSMSSKFSGMMGEMEKKSKILKLHLVRHIRQLKKL